MDRLLSALVNLSRHSLPLFAAAAGNIPSLRGYWWTELCRIRWPLVFRGIFHKAKPMFKLCSELQGAGGSEIRDESVVSDPARNPVPSVASSVKKATARRMRPRLFTPYEMAARLAPPSQGFTFRDYLIYNANVASKKGGLGV